MAEFPGALDSIIRETVQQKGGIDIDGDARASLAIRAGMLTSLFDVGAEGLPTVDGENVLLAVVECAEKCWIPILLQEPETAVDRKETPASPRSPDEKTATTVPWAEAGAATPNTPCDSRLAVAVHDVLFWWSDGAFRPMTVRELWEQLDYASLHWLEAFVGRFLTPVVWSQIAGPILRWPILPIFADEIYHVGARGLGMLYAAPAIGALVGSGTGASTEEPPMPISP